MFRNSIVQLIRTPKKSIMFLLLILVSTMFLALGSSLWIINNRNMEYYKDSFVTIGTVEQRATSVKQVKWWSQASGKFYFYHIPGYEDRIPLSVLDFDDANYIHKPENRPCYFSYNSEFKTNREYENPMTIVEFVSLEDGFTNEPVEVSISKILIGFQAIEGQSIFIYDEEVENPIKLMKGKTYIACLYFLPRSVDGEWSEEYLPMSVILTRQYNQNGTRLSDELDSDDKIYEVTTDFYSTEVGNRFQEFVKSMDQYNFSIPVTGTNATILLMPFYNKSAYLVDGRDISEQEYEDGKKVCLIQKKFAEENKLDIGDSVQLRLYSADYESSASQKYGSINLNQEGEAYSVFEDSSYTIVGIYETSSFNSNQQYSFAEKEVIIPSKSIKNSDQHNIVGFGTLKGNMTSFQISNEDKEEFVKLWESLGIEQLDITFYDRGYSKLKVGMDNMERISFMIIIIGVVVVFFVLVLFSNIFILKEERRIAIERSLGMDKSKCFGTILSSISMILILGSVLGGSIGGSVSFYSYQKNLDTSYFETLYSAGSVESEVDEDERDVKEDIKFVVLISLLCVTAVIFIGEIILIQNISRKLKQEPMVMLYRLRE